VTLEDLVKEIEARTLAQVQDIRSGVANEKKAIHDHTEREIARITADEELAAEREVEQEKIRMLASARLQAKKVSFDAWERRVDSGLKLIRARLQTFTEGPEYPAMLEKMANAGISVLGANSRILIREEDTYKIPESLQTKVARSRPIQSMGGLIIESHDGEKRLNLTFEELLRWNQDAILELLLKQ
jgi:V/A-type H+-transporting ATPase subunit E